MLTDVGLGTPFVNVSFSGLLWGYEDELYCLKNPVPRGCKKGDSPFGEDYEDEAESGWDFKRKKRSLSNGGIFEKPGEVEEYLKLVVLRRRINLQQKNQEAKIVVWEVQCAYRG